MRGCLKAIKRTTIIFAASTGLSILIGILIIACAASAPELQAPIFLGVGAAVSTFMANLWVREYRKLKTARLIVENPIFSIRTAVIHNGTFDVVEAHESENIEVFVSYFGILLGAKIIKFNQDGILLKGAEIGQDFISFTYGTDKRVQTTRLLHPTISRMELESIAEKFRYETGIVPIFTN